MWGADYTGKDAANLYRQEDLVEWGFRAAEQFFPGNELIINEAHCRVWNDIWYQRERSPYYMQIERAMHKGARIDAVGLQFHMFHSAEKVVEATRNFYDPKRLSTGTCPMDMRPLPSLVISQAVIRHPS